jgi:tetratricopeptide (TPR) repeat protein
MPITYNGIGTHYYGKKNLQTRSGVCPHCRRTVNLASYDTGLYFVIVFIPIIPLGRKRIIDSCPACRRHYVVDLQKWETAKQLETSGALEKYRSQPTPENAIEAHRQLLAFQQNVEAVELERAMREKFADNARVQVYLALSLSQLGRLSEAETFFTRALELRPDMPEARVGVAQKHIRAKRLEEARQLLDFLEKPGAGQLYSLAPLEQLAVAYQQVGRHADALTLFGRLLAEIPSLAEHRGFRKEVQKSEGAFPGRTSILPKTKFSMRKFFQRQGSVTVGSRSISPRTLLIVGGAAAVLITIAMVAGNENVRRHRKVYIANAFGPDLKLEISGRGQVKMLRGITEVVLPEGHYQAKFSGPIQEQVEMDIRSGYFNRWFGKPVWILNPGGAAILVSERAVYKANPEPVAYSYLFGQSFQYLPEIDYPFETMPERVSLSSHEDQKVLTGLEIFHGKPLEAVYGLENSHRTKEAMNLAEWDLKRNPEDKKMLQAYAELAGDTNELVRVERFLESGLSNRPVHVEWHRTYQDTRKARHGDKQLMEVYNAMLRGEPDNSALLYLRGRVSRDRAEGAEFFERSHKADQNNPYPLFALAYDKASSAKWSEAQPMLDQVVSLRPEDEQFCALWKTVCLAQGRYDTAEQVFQSKIKFDPLDWRSAVQLCDILVAGGKRKEAEQVISELVRAFRSQSRDSADKVHKIVQAHYLYEIGDFAALETIGRADKSTSGKLALFYALVEQSRLDDATKVFPADQVKSPALILAISLAYRMEGKAKEAEKWQETLLEEFHSGDADGLRAASLIEGKTQVSSAVLEEMEFPSQLKALLLADLAMIYPEKREQLNASARQFNVERSFPYHLVQRATSKTP